jgi:hypothetical protein
MFDRSLRMALRCALVAAAAANAGPTSGAPLARERVLELCAQVDGPAHCARLIEAEQLKVLPNLAVRDGDRLKVTLFPSGAREFVDVSTFGDSRSYAVWDYWSPVNAVVFFTTEGLRIGFAVLQRATNQLTMLAAEPLLAPNRQHLAVADFCTDGCDNEITVWRVARDGIRKTLAWKPAAAWTDVTLQWNEPADALTIEYTLAGEEKPRSQIRKLDAPDWKRS